VKTYAYGFPRLGKNREFKKVVEAFWKKTVSQSDTAQALDNLQAEMLSVYQNNVDLYALGEMTGYDPMLDTAIMVGLYNPKGMDEYYELCRGKNALEMTKWFNTNYHYLVPDFSQINNESFTLNWNKPKQYLDKFQKGIPALIGPFTFLKLSKGLAQDQFKETLLALALVYKEILSTLGQAHIEEPAFVMDLSEEEVTAIQECYGLLSESQCAINLITYYGAVDFFKELCDLPVSAIGLDFVNGGANLDALKRYGFPKDKVLIAGLVNGRNVWRTDMEKVSGILKDITQQAQEVIVSNAAPLYHLPISLENEQNLEDALKERLAFATEKLDDIRVLARNFSEGLPAQPNQSDGHWQNPDVQSRVAQLKEEDFNKKVDVAERRRLQDQVLGLPLFPTTTIGSYPQTAEVRKKRAECRKGILSADDYKNYVDQKIQDLVKFQEELGLDVLVHGEYERTDMVEFFAEKLDGIATTEAGWIISYGTRGYRPPIIFGDVSRPEPMTIREIQYAQTLTQRPVKGMLTGAVTIIAWSFAREDIPIAQVAYQIGLALKDEIRDYEKAGIKIVQIDEPAIREKAPIKKKDWPAYFDWAIKSFKLTSNTDPATQIHTHMCYSEFKEIVKEIDAMDFDVISIETTRSRGDIIESFEKIDFKKQIGLGVWDIHSPAVPSVTEMKAVVDRALQVIPKENFWINPDCGLKTRDWPETEAALTNLVALAKDLRK